MKQIVLMVVAFLSLAVFAMPAVVSADAAKDAVCSGVALTNSGSTGCDAPAGSTSVDSIIKTIIEVLGLLVGVVSVIMIIFGGFRFVTSSGDSAKIASARETILYAIVGLVVAALSQAIVRFVLSKATT